MPPKGLRDEVVNLIKTLVPPNRLTAEMASIEDMKEEILSYADQLTENDSELRSTLENFRSFYEESLRMNFLFFT